MTTELQTSRLEISEETHATAPAEPGADAFLEALLAGRAAQSAPVAPAPVALAPLRASAAARLAHMRLPTIRDEDWRFANLKPLRELPFTPAPAPGDLTRDAIQAWVLPEASASRLVFVNGHYAPGLSDLSGLPAGVSVQRLSEAPAELLSRRLGTLAGEDTFTILNSALVVDGALIRIEPGAAVDAPIHLLFVGAPAEGPLAAFPRVLLLAREGCSVTLIEDYVTLDAGTGAVFTDAVTEIVLDADARVNHVRLQRERKDAFHIGRSVATLAHTATYRQHAVSLGARFSRFDPVAIQDAEGVDVALHGLMALGDGQFGDTHSIIDHAKPMGTSRQVQKCVLDGSARGVFNGKILVRKGAAATNSAQQSRNLLLSEKAKIDTKPQLEIFADDVRCAHGATVGQLDPDEVFYLQSRGLSRTEARNLLTYAFAAEVIDHVPVASLRDTLRARVMSAVSSQGGI